MSKQGGIFLFKKRRGQNSVVGGGQFCVDIPIILVGGLRNIDTIDRIMAETKIAAISMSRPLIREPRLVERWAAGDRQDAACIACNGCFNPNGTICFFELGEEEKAAQKEVMKFLSSLGKKS